MSWTVERWREVLPGAQWIGDTSALEAISDFFIDSREVPKGGCFVPLAGEQTDGHRFLDDAWSHGAVASFCSEAEWKKGVSVPSGRVLIVVPSVLEALSGFAAAHLDAFPGTVRLGVTGSNGKTTTKELLAAALSVYGPTYSTPGNLNSEIGLPLTALRMTKGYAFAVFEMGINHRGEMDSLASIVRPLVSIVTNVGTAHIGKIGSQHEIALEKKKIFSRSGAVAIAVLPARDRFLPVLTEGFEGSVRLFGRDQTGFRVIADHGLDGIEFEWKGTSLRLQLPGWHNADNALAVWEALEALGLDPRKAVDALASVRPSSGRGQSLRGRFTWLIDSYNANADSMAGLFSMLRSWTSRPRTVLVLGSMKELGEHEEELHRRVGAEAASLDVQAIFFLGAEAEAAFETCRDHQFPGHLVWVNEFDELDALIGEYLRPGDLIVLKGSRSNRLERLSHWETSGSEAQRVL